MQVNVEHDRLKHCVRLNIAHVETTLSSWKCSSKKPNCWAAHAQRYFTPAALPRREDLKFGACRSMLSTTSWSTVWGWTLLMWTQRFLVENVHQKMSGKCSRYFTPAALPTREDLKFGACRSMLSTTSRSTVWGWALLMWTKLFLVENVPPKFQIV